jgi:uncharacterized delta-60 repeat protein
VNDVLPILCLSDADAYTNNDFNSAALYVSRTASVVEGQPYILHLSATEAVGSTASVLSWQVNWGDGNISTYYASDYEGGVFPVNLAVNHSYFGVATAVLSVTATDTDGTYAATVNNDYDFNQSGRVLTDINSGSSDSAYKPLVQPDGKVLVAGSTNGKLSLARYNPNGQLDNTFNAAGTLPGTLVTSINFSATPSACIALQSDGSILAVGNGSNFMIDIVQRFSPNGVQDTTNFGAAGTLTTDFATAIAVQSDDRIILYGNSKLERFSADGKQQDMTFGTSGSTTTVRGLGVGAITIQPNDAILLAGYDRILFGQDEVVVARYTKDGAIDTTFGRRRSRRSRFSPLWESRSRDGRRRLRNRSPSALQQLDHLRQQSRQRLQRHRRRRPSQERLQPHRRRRRINQRREWEQSRRE